MVNPLTRSIHFQISALLPNNEQCVKLSLYMLAKLAFRSAMPAVSHLPLFKSRIITNIQPGELYTLEHGLSVRRPNFVHIILIYEPFFISLTVASSKDHHPTRIVVFPRSSLSQIQENTSLAPYTSIWSPVLSTMSKVVLTGLSFIRRL